MFERSAATLTDCPSRLRHRPCHMGADGGRCFCIIGRGLPAGSVCPQGCRPAYRAGPFSFGHRLSRLLCSARKQAGRKRTISGGCRGCRICRRWIRWSRSTAARFSGARAFINRSTAIAKGTDAMIQTTWSRLRFCRLRPLVSVEICGERLLEASTFSAAGYQTGNGSNSGDSSHQQRSTRHMCGARAVTFRQPGQSQSRHRARHGSSRCEVTASESGASRHGKKTTETATVDSRNLGLAQNGSGATASRSAHCPGVGTHPGGLVGSRASSSSRVAETATTVNRARSVNQRFAGDSGRSNTRKAARDCSASRRKPLKSKGFGAGSCPSWRISADLLTKQAGRHRMRVLKPKFLNFRFREIDDRQKGHIPRLPCASGNAARVLSEAPK